VNVALVYSIYWQVTKITINQNVINNPDNALLLSLLINAWWLYVIVAPDDNKIIVFNNGNSVGLIASIPIGGQQSS